MILKKQDTDVSVDELTAYFVFDKVSIQFCMFVVVPLKESILGSCVCFVRRSNEEEWSLDKSHVHYGQCKRVNDPEPQILWDTGSVEQDF